MEKPLAAEEGREDDHEPERPGINPICEIQSRAHVIHAQRTPNQKEKREKLFRIGDPGQRCTCPGLFSYHPSGI